MQESCYTGQVIMSKMKQKYLEEYEKYEHIKIYKKLYKLKSNKSILYKVLDVDEVKESVLIESRSSGVKRQRTLHWCRKNLEPIGVITNLHNLELEDVDVQ